MATATQTEIIKYTVGVFGAAPGGYMTALEEIVTSGATTGQLALAMADLMDDLNPTVAAYQSTATTTDFATAFMNNLLGAAVDATTMQLAIDVAVELIDEGGLTRGQLVVAAIDFLDAQADTDTTWGAAKSQLDNQVEVAAYYQDNMETLSTDLAALQAIVADVTDDDTTVTDAIADIDADINAGETFTLTTGTDAIVGTAANDTITGTSASLSADKTLSVADTIDGGDGSDTLQIDMQAAFTGFTTGSMKNVESVELTNSGSVARDFNAANISGVDQYTLTGAVNLSGLTEISTVVANDRTAALTVTYASAAVAGTADIQALSINNVGTADDTSTTGTNEEVAVAVTVAGVESTDLTVSGTNVVDLTALASKTVTATGSGALKVTEVSATTTKFDASDVSGNVYVDTGTGVSMTMVATGSGNDTVRVENAANDLTANATLTGGEGDDVITFVAATGAVQYAMTGFETVQLAAQAGAATLSMSKSSGVTDVVALGGAATDGALDQDVTFASLGSGDLAIDLQGVNANAKTITTDNTGSTTITVSTPASGATQTAPSANDLSIVAAGTTAVDMTIDSAMSWTGALTAAKATSIDLAINGNAGATSIITAAAATEMTISSVATASDLDIVADKLNTLNITNAKDLTLTGATSLAALETLTTSGAGDINLTGIALAKLNSATMTNTGDIDLNNIGSATLDYSTTITSAGAATFDVGTMTTNGQAITLSVTEAVGAITAAAIDAGTGNVSVTAGGTSTTGLAAITGKNVTVDAGDSLGAVTFGGDITATGNVTIVGSELNANDLATQNVVLGGASQAVSFTGGIGADDLDVIAATTNTSITLSGDFGIGTDAITLDLATNDHTNALTVTATGLSNYETLDITLADAGGKESTVALAAGNGVDTIVWGQAIKTTVTGFDTTEDSLSVAALGGSGAVTAVAANAIQGAAVTTQAYVFADGADGTGAETIASYTDLADVAAFLDGGLTSVAADVIVAVINDLVGDKTYIYEATSQVGGTFAGGVVLVGVITEESGAALVAGDIAN